MAVPREPPNEDDVRRVSPSWTTKQITYLGGTSPFLLIAAIEWALHLSMFLYCFVTVLWKASGKHRYSIRILSVGNIVFLLVTRVAFLFVTIFTLPLPPVILLYFPQPMTRVLTEFALWSFAALLEIPALICIWQLVTHNVGRERMIQYLLNEQTAPKVVIIMPCFNEEPHILLRTVDSIVDCEYPPSCMHIFLSFDGDRIEGLFVNTLEKLGVPVPLDRYEDSIDVQYRSCRITVSRFLHGGKRNCQKLTYRVVDKVYANYLEKRDDLFVLFIDSDCILDKYCIQNFMYEMELKPGSKGKMNAMTGVITSTTVENNFWTLLQDMEYVHGQIFERSVESACGAVTCLPGALTMLRFSAFKNMSKYYFANNVAHCDDMFDYSKCHLGEDRWLTHLFMIGATERYQIQMNPGAFCKTEAVQSFKSLVKQRRRWFLGFITNEACMLTDVRLWVRYPLVIILRLAQNTIRTTALLFWMMLFSVLTTEQDVSHLPLQFIGFSLLLNWLLMGYLAIKLHRYKLMAYPLMFVCNPIFNLTYMVQAILTSGQRTWGGPRADAERADGNQALVQTVTNTNANGADLGMPSRTPRLHNTASGPTSDGHMPLMPSSHLEGRFTTTAAAGSKGWFRRANSLFIRDSSGESTASITSVSSTYRPIPTPRRVESLMGPEGVITYRSHQVEQDPAGGAFLDSDEGNLTGLVSDNDPLLQSDAHARAHSADSDSAITLHFHVPRRGPIELPAIRHVPRYDLLPLPLPSSAYRPDEQCHQISRGRAEHISRSPLVRTSFEWVAAHDASPHATLGKVELGTLENVQDSRSEGKHVHRLDRKPKRLQKKHAEVKNN